jgi:hypothetical protein
MECGATGSAVMTDRERWLVIQGFCAGYVLAGGSPLDPGLVSDKAKAWLDACVVSDVTIEMLLEYEANKGVR